MKPNIEKIVFNVRGKKLELTSDEAKELKQILSDLFGETKVIHEWRPEPYRWNWPYVTWTGLTAYTDTSSAFTNNASTDTLFLSVN